MENNKSAHYAPFLSVILFVFCCVGRYFYKTHPQINQTRYSGFDLYSCYTETGTRAGNG